jgi:hypothetical protein
MTARNKDLIISIHNNNNNNLSMDRIYLSLYRPFVGPWPLFQFLHLYTVGMTPWTGDQSVTRPLPTHRTETQNNCTQTSIPWVGFEPTIPVFERAKTVRALDRAATVIGFNGTIDGKLFYRFFSHLHWFRHGLQYLRNSRINNLTTAGLYSIIFSM